MGFEADVRADWLSWGPEGHKSGRSQNPLLSSRKYCRGGFRVLWLWGGLPRRWVRFHGSRRKERKAILAKEQCKSWRRGKIVVRVTEP